jgi:hypothetical protein
MSSKTSFEPYEAPDSLWSLIKQYVNESEVDDIKSVIGESLVDQTIELHTEIETLLDIWRDYRNQTLYDLDQISRVNSSKLPEPPEVRDRLIKEIEFFIKQMREKFDDRSFSRQLATNHHNLDVISYVLSSDNKKSTRSSSSMNQTSNMSANHTPRPMSALSRHGTETPCKPITLEPTNSQQQPMKTTVEYNLDENKLNCVDIDDIVSHLRELFQAETATLLKDIDFLYECIDRETEYRSQSKATARQPTLNELKEERKRLEDNILPMSNMRGGTTITQQSSSSSRSPSASSISSISLGLKSPSPMPLAPLDLSALRSHKTSTTTKHNTAKFTPKTPLYNNFIRPSMSSSSSKITRLPASKLDLAKKPTNLASKRLSSTENILNLTTESTSTSLLSADTSPCASANASTLGLVGQINKQQKAVEKFRHMVLHTRETT